MSERSSVIIIGSGPAGYTAAIYLARAKMQPLLFSGKEPGGQLMYTTVVENFPGFMQGINGPDLMIAMRGQAERFGTTIKDVAVTGIEKTENGFRVWKDQEAYEADAVLITTGARSKTLNLPNEQKLTGRGISTCAVCDAAFFRDKEVYVIGGGDSAMEDSLALTRHARLVHLVHRRGEFRASKIMQDRVLSHEKIKIHWNTEVIGLQDDGARLTGVTLKDLASGDQHEVPAEGLFYAIGHIPTTDFLPDFIQRNQAGYIVTRFTLDQPSIHEAGQHLDEQGLLEFPTMTTQEGVFAAGDCVDFRYRQAVTAAAFGTMAALDIERWLEAYHRN